MRPDRSNSVFHSLSALDSQIGPTRNSLLTSYDQRIRFPTTWLFAPGPSHRIHCRMQRESFQKISWSSAGHKAGSCLGLVSKCSSLEIPPEHIQERHKWFPYRGMGQAWPLTAFCGQYRFWAPGGGVATRELVLGT